MQLSKYAADLLSEAGGIPERYAGRVCIDKASTGDEVNQNAVITFSMDGVHVGFILATLNKPITYRGKEGHVYLTVDHDWSITKRNRKGRESMWGKSLELYNDAIWFKDLESMFSFYDSHKDQITQLQKEIPV